MDQEIKRLSAINNENEGWGDDSSNDNDDLVKEDGEDYVLDEDDLEDDDKLLEDGEEDL